MFGFFEFFFYILFYCCFAYKIKSRRRLLKTMAIFLNFVFKTALIWLVLGGFFCVFSQSETICNLHSCYNFALVLQKNCTPFSANQNWVIFWCILLRVEIRTQLRIWKCARKGEIQLLSRVFCYSWLVCLLGFWLRKASLVKVGNPISDGIVFAYDVPN